MEAIIRPPSESSSFILLAMLGCSNNTCTFCPSYKQRKFAFRDIYDVIDELDKWYNNERRIFLADGDAVSIRQEDLVVLLQYIKDKYPQVERVSSYITPRTALNKSLAELKELRTLGLELVYLGVETGSDELLKDIKKGVTRKEMIEAGRKIKKSGIKLSVTVLLGLGGKEKSKEHAKATASILNEIQPDYIGALTLMVVKGTEFHDKVKSSEVHELENYEYLQELYWMIEGLELKSCIFRSNHASNYASVGGTLPEDKEMMLKQLKEILDNKERLKPEMFRGL
ncbi:MAG: radical SAM protein [Nanoarchaeota archaeon]|nr:radical SAM protein [Nanoarchaeota archaeon]MBU1703738.1 radical SAM protein [Nanoarchaeota archaeon]